ncbi:MAG: hypothetical protein OEU09_05630 [Rhodospirillales bacterium]|nr:hypothetical protein [Rhodospirillales bacterium]MDH3966715.1 hypothetical protein [Rhodospirillales bacterium]
MTHFTEAILAASKARAAPLCGYNKRRATWLAAKIARPSGGAYRGARGVAALARCTHRAAHRAYPGDPIRSHEMSHYQ